ncbi:acyltransferase family protein [Streptomyces sp. NPDC059009]|uniref:acyltransferase family protein n=1 Tax=Streptomyces sp. NPDC059009 TaxID=3346694 RepID=UPI00369407A3
MTRLTHSDARDPFFDNAKFLLIVLVALGHFWEQIIGGAPALRAVHTVVYAFHMPAFALLCGYFSQRFSTGPAQMRRMTETVVIPYLIFETLYSATYSAERGYPFAITPTEPTYLCWFLIALFLWRLSTPLWQAIRHPVAVAVLISLTAGITTMSYDLALPRVLMFLPWFVLGLRLHARHFTLLRTAAARPVAVAVLFLAGAGAYLLAPGPDDHWLSMDVSYHELGVGWQEYLLLRVGIFALSAVLVAAFFACVPRRRTSFTALGAATMYPYLLHGLLVRAAEAAGLYPSLQALGLTGQVLLSVVVVVLVVVLSSAPVRRLFRPLVEPRLPFLFTPRSSTQVTDAVRQK